MRCFIPHYFPFLYHPCKLVVEVIILTFLNKFVRSLRKSEPTKSKQKMISKSNIDKEAKKLFSSKCTDRGLPGPSAWNLPTIQPLIIKLLNVNDMKLKHLDKIKDDFKAQTKTNRLVTIDLVVAMVWPDLYKLCRESLEHYFPTIKLLRDMLVDFKLDPVTVVRYKASFLFSTLFDDENECSLSSQKELKSFVSDKIDLSTKDFQEILFRTACRRISGKSTPDLIIIATCWALELKADLEEGTVVLPDDEVAKCFPTQIRGIRILSKLIKRCQNAENEEQEVLKIKHQYWFGLFYYNYITNPNVQKRRVYFGLISGLLGVSINAIFSYATLPIYGVMVLLGFVDLIYILSLWYSTVDNRNVILANICTPSKFTELNFFFFFLN